MSLEKIHIEEGQHSNIYQIPNISLVMVYKISPSIQAQRANIQKLPIKHQLHHKVIPESKEKNDKKSIDTRKQQIKEKIKRRIREQIDCMLNQTQKSKLKKTIPSSLPTEHDLKSLTIKVNHTISKSHVQERQTPNSNYTHLTKRSILFQSMQSRQRNIKSSVDRRAQQKRKITPHNKMYNYRRSMSSDIRVRTKLKLNQISRNKSTTKKQDISIMPWDIEQGEEEFQL